jgi:hypothetical protein
MNARMSNVGVPSAIIGSFTPGVHSRLGVGPGPSRAICMGRGRRGGRRRLPGAYCVRRAVAIDCWNRFAMADVMSWSVLTWENSPGEAQFCMLAAICGWNGAI